MIRSLRRACPVPLDVLFILPVVVWCLHCAEGTTADPTGYPNIPDEPPILNYVADAEGNLITSAAMGDKVWLVGERFAPQAKAYFGDTEAAVASVSEDGTRIATVVPQMPQAGSVEVHVSVKGKDSNSVPLFVSLVPGGNLVNALGPVDVAVDSVHHRVFVVNAHSFTVTVLGRDSQGMDYQKNVAVGEHPRYAVVDQETGIAYVSCDEGDEINVIEPERDFQVTAFATPQGAHPGPLIINSAEHLLYVSNTSVNTVGVFSLATQSWAQDLSVGAYPGQMALDVELRRLYVLCRDSNTVSVYEWPGYRYLGDIQVGFAPEDLAVDERTHRVYVACRGAREKEQIGVVSVVDGQDLVVLKAVEVGWEPVDVELSDSLDRVFVCNYLSDTVSVIDVERLEVESQIPVDIRPLALAIMDESKRLLVVSEYGTEIGRGSMSIVDTRRAVVDRTIPLDSGAWDTAVDPGLDTAYVPNLSSDSLTIIKDVSKKPVYENRVLGAAPDFTALDPVTGDLILGSYNGAVSVVGANLGSCVTKRVGMSIWDVAVDAARRLVYATDAPDEKLLVLKLPTLEKVRSIAVGHRPQYLVVDSRRSKLFVSNWNASRLTSIDLDSYQRKDRWHLDFEPYEMTLCDQAGKLFVISRSQYEEDNHLVVVDTETEMVVKNVHMPGKWKYLEKLYVDEANQLVFAVNNGGVHGDHWPSVTVLDCASGDVIKSIEVGRHPTGIAMSGHDGMAFVTNFLDSTVSVIGPEHTVIDTIPVGKGPSSIAYSGELGSLFVHNLAEENAAVWALDASTYWTLSVTEAGTAFGFPMDTLVLNPRSNQLWVVDSRLGRIYAFRGSDLAKR